MTVIPYDSGHADDGLGNTEIIRSELWPVIFARIVDRPKTLEAYPMFVTASELDGVRFEQDKATASNCVTERVLARVRPVGFELTTNGLAASAVEVIQYSVVYPTSSRQVDTVSFRSRLAFTVVSPTLVHDMQLMPPIDKKKLSERDICTKFITPAIENAGWHAMLQMREEVSFTDGRILFRGKRVTRGKTRRADYILYFKPNIPLAVVEAKNACGNDWECEAPAETLFARYVRLGRSLALPRNRKLILPPS